MRGGDLSKGFLLYRGPSAIDGKPIVCIVTNPQQARLNAKTQRVVQTYILRDDIDPLDAIKSGDDFSICGDCVHRGPGDGSNRSCYVQVWSAPRNIWLAHKLRHKYRQPRCHPSTELANRLVRLGSYGDPAAVPVKIWADALRHVSGTLGYTHQWRSCAWEFKDWCMASVDSEVEQFEAQATGWRTFRVRREHDRVLPGEVVCAASLEAGKKTTCEACRACGGHNAKARAPVVIAAHGQHAIFFEGQRKPMAKKEPKITFEVPTWVPPLMREAYIAIGRAKGEEEAASAVRQLKRAPTQDRAAEILHRALGNVR